MAKDIQDRIGQILGNGSARALAGTAVTEAIKALGSQRSSNGGGGDDKSRGGMSGMRGLAAGAGAAAVAPLAAKGLGKLIKGHGTPDLTGGPKQLAEKATSKLGDTVKGQLKDKVEEAGGPSGILKDTVKGALPFGGGDDDGGGGKQDTDGVGKGRRMPIQQSIDIGLPVETVYNQWTQFEDWPKFMHRVTRASQEDPCKVNFSVKIWGKTKEFTAEIETQRPDDRIKWKTSQGMNLAGVVAFRELGPNLTRVILSFDVAPGSLIEKYARGARYVKRAARADLHRFAAFIEMLENETGAWRGVIEDGELVEDHDPSYDKDREYGDADELVHGRGSEDEGEDENEDDEDSESDENEEDSGARSRRSGGSSRAQSRSGSSSRSTRRGGSSRASASGRSSSGRSSSGGRSSGGRSGSSSRSSSSRGSSGSRPSRNGSGRSSGSSGARSSSGRSSGSSGRGSSRSGSGSSRSSSGSSRSSSGSSRSSSGSSRSSNGRSSSGRTSSGSTRGRSSNGSGSGRGSSGSSRSRSSSNGSSGRSRSGSSSGSSRRSSSQHEGRQRSRSSRRG